MTRRRRILHADKIFDDVFVMFCLLMFLQLKGYYSQETNPMLLYSTGSDIRLVNTAKLNKVNTIVKELEQGSAVDYLYRKSLICWSDQTAMLIQCTNYNDTHIGEKDKIVSDGLITPVGIAVDWYTDKIYWTDGETNRIEVISIKEKHRKVLFWSEVDLARAIAVVPHKGILFWTDWGEVPKIERAGMNGEPSTRTVVVKDDIFWPNGITVDYDNELLYWVDAQLHFVDVMDFNGQNRKRIVKTDLEYPYAITIINQKLYWTDWKTWAIHVWDMSTNGPKVKELLKSKPVPVDIKAYAASRQRLPARLPCAPDNGGCSHLCLLSPSEPGYTCACPTGIKLQEDGHRCHAGPQAMVVVAARGALLRVSLDSGDHTPAPLPLRELRRAMAVDWEPGAGLLYWTDSAARSVSRARLDGSQRRAVVRGGAPDGLAVDAAAGNLYWSDPAADTLSVARLDGAHARVLVHEGLDEPRAVAVLPAAGLLFWSDWGERRPCIERAALDGSARRVLVAERLAWPNGLALDASAGRLYWGDARTRRIEACDLDGARRTELYAGDMLHVFGLALLGDHLYWTDMQKRTLERIDKRTGGSRETVVEQTANMMGVRGIAADEAAPQSRCRAHNGGCSHLCFNRPDDYVCGCPLGMELDEAGRTCSQPAGLLVVARPTSIALASLRPRPRTVAAPAPDTLPLRDLRDVCAIAVDGNSNMLYWADTKARSISRARLDGSQAERLVEGLGVVEGLAVDWGSQNVYWSDSGTQRIELARLDGGARRAVLWQGLRRPRALALDPPRGLLYWAEGRALRRAALDGSGAEAAGAPGRAAALAAGPDGALYVAALDPPLLAARAPAGAMRTLARAAPAALALHAGTLYWLDSTSGEVWSCETSSCTPRLVHAKAGGGGGGGGGGALGVATRGGGAGGGGGPCAAANAGCEHVCVPLPGGRARCLCPAHYTLRADNLTCREPEEFLLYAQRGALGRVVLAAGECPDAALPLPALRGARALDYDPVGGHVYWIEEDTRAVRRAPLPAGGAAPGGAAEGEVLLRGAAYLALDPVGRALYWTAAGGDTVNVTSLRNVSRGGPLPAAEAERPAHLAFHAARRLLVWNDVGAGRIVRAAVDGSGGVRLARARDATALALDALAGRVYWAAGRQLRSVGLDGSDERVVWQGAGAWTVALAAWGGWVWAGGGERALVRVPTTRAAAAAPVAHVARVSALAAALPAPRAHACAGGGPCALAACGPAAACACGLACARPQPCAAGHFRCEADSACIPDHWKCDGQRDCADGSDEAGCGACAGGVRCADGSCGAALSACAGGARCGPRPLPHAFRCDGDLCLPPALLCDGRAHCTDGSDEAAPACGPPPAESRAGAGWRVAAACGCAGGAAGAAALGGALLRRWRRQRRARAPPAPALALTKRLVPAAPASASSGSGSGVRVCGPANPPPSPATVGTRRRPYRHYRASNRPPPPTPASTDANESEPEARAPPPSPAH